MQHFQTAGTQYTSAQFHSPDKLNNKTALTEKVTVYRCFFRGSDVTPLIRSPKSLFSSIPTHIHPLDQDLDSFKGVTDELFDVPDVSIESYSAVM